MRRRRRPGGLGDDRRRKGHTNVLFYRGWRDGCSTVVISFAASRRCDDVQSLRKAYGSNGYVCGPVGVCKRRSAARGNKITPNENTDYKPNGKWKTKNKYEIKTAWSDVRARCVTLGTTCGGECRARAHFQQPRAIFTIWIAPERRPPSRSRILATARARCRPSLTGLRAATPGYLTTAPPRATARSLTRSRVPLRHCVHAVCPYSHTRRQQQCNVLLLFEAIFFPCSVFLPPTATAVPLKLRATFAARTSKTRRDAAPFGPLICYLFVFPVTRPSVDHDRFYSDRLLIKSSNFKLTSLSVSCRRIPTYRFRPKQIYQFHMGA